MREVLSQGSGLGRRLLERPLEAGHVSAFLPVDTDLKAAHHFGLGGILHRGRFDSSDLSHLAEPVTRQEMEARLVLFIDEYLRLGGQRYAIFENVGSASSSPWLVNRAAPYFLTNTTACFYVGSHALNEGAIRAALRAGQSYYLIGILVRSESDRIRSGSTVDADTLDSLAIGADHIVVSAYDGEGELIWSR